MSGDLQLSAEELNELDLIVRQDLGASRVELHHTWNSHYKEVVKRHIELVERVLAAIEQARSERPESRPEAMQDRQTTAG